MWVAEGRCQPMAGEQGCPRRLGSWGQAVVLVVEGGMENPMAGTGVDSPGGFLWGTDQAQAFKDHSAPLIV